MRIFKSIIVCLLASVICISMASCSSDDYSSPLKGKTFSDITFDSSQSSNSVSLGEGDLSAFTVNSSDAWCSASIVGSNLNVTVQPNDTYSERQATITITDPGDATVVSFKAIQKQNNAILVDESTYIVPEAGGEISIKVQSNVNYSVEIPSDATWLTLSTNSSTRGLESSTINLTASGNNSGDERIAIVKLTDTSSGTTSEFTIKQELTPSFSIDTESIEVDEFGSEVEVSVTSNIAINVNFSESWVSSSGVKETDGFGFIQKIKISELPAGTSSRTANVTFTDKLGKWNLSKTLTVKQTMSLLIDEKDFEILVGDTHTLKLINNTGSSVSWESSNTSVATVDDKGIVTGVGKGTAKISVKSADGKYSDEVSVTVKQSLAIQDKDIELMAGGSYTLTVDNKTGGSLSWKSSNTSVATVNGSGVVTGVGKGTAEITATSADGELSATCSVTVKDVTDFIIARSSGGAVMMLNTLIQYGSSLNWTFINNSSETVRLKSMQLVDGETGYEGNIMDVNADVDAGSSVSYSTTIGLLGIHVPVTCRFRYEYKGKEYVTTAVYSGSLW